MDKIPPQKIITALNKEIPQIWRTIRKIREQRGSGGVPMWPEWCYFPETRIFSVEEREEIQEFLQSDIGPSLLAAAAAWRLSQGIYKFDAALYQSLTDQTLDGKIPAEALIRLPEWCVYIVCSSETKLNGEVIIGFWTYLGFDYEYEITTLNFVFFKESGGGTTFSLKLIDGTLEEAIRNDLVEIYKEGKKDYIDKRVFRTCEEIVPFIQLALYLCAENADMKRPTHPMKRARPSGRIDTPREPLYWDVGIRVGAAIRKYNNADRHSPENDTGTSVGPSKRPHVRKSHWHHFWVGPKDGKRELVVRWLHPVFVNSTSDSNLPMVIHPVKQGV